MKNKGLIITMIIILSIIAIGMAIFLYFILSGNFDLKPRMTAGKKSETIIFDESYDAERVSQIEILSSTGDVEIKESTDGKIRSVVYGQMDDKLKTDFSDGNLKIDYSQSNKNVFGFNFYINEIILYVPKDYDKIIKIDSDYGDFSTIDLENATLEIKGDCGDITIGKIKNVRIESNYGDVNIESVLNKMDIESDCGDIKIGSAMIYENSSIQSDFGDVKIGETNNIYIDAKVDLGEVKVYNNNRKSEITLKIENDCGDIKVENEIKE